ncbi:hypothetical protein RND81_14G096300 [Saponaria officinalis]|uniref:F-box protein n=1 Tax=Saponaria officinalis TaxID=3572 RepID=A0AAW1GMQ7_SAPOF
MESLPIELCLKIFFILDYQNLATAQQVCRKWNVLGSDNVLWANLFKERWGENRAGFYNPVNSKSWKDVYQVQDRCDRLGLGLKIIREGADYYLIHRGEIQRHLGSRRPRKAKAVEPSSQNIVNEDGSQEGPPSNGILERILFFIGDLEVATVEAKRTKLT